jgi:hypothetical protein
VLTPRQEDALNSSLIGKIEKAKRYADERDRIHITSLDVHFDGENSPHDISLENGQWRCSCDFFEGWGVCSHTMALERVFDGMLPKEALGQERERRSA